MLRKIKIVSWDDKVPTRKMNPETKQMEVVDELQNNNTLKLLNFVVNGMDQKNLPKGNIDQVRFWNRFEKAMRNAGLDADNSDAELKEFIYLDIEAWKIVTEKGFKDLDSRIGRNMDAFEAIELIFEAEEFDPNAEENAAKEKKAIAKSKAKAEAKAKAKLKAEKTAKEIVDSEA